MEVLVISNISVLLKKCIFLWVFAFGSLSFTWLSCWLACKTSLTWVFTAVGRVQSNRLVSVSHCTPHFRCSAGTSARGTRARGTHTLFFFASTSPSSDPAVMPGPKMCFFVALCVFNLCLRKELNATCNTWSDLGSVWVFSVWNVVTYPDQKYVPAKVSWRQCLSAIEYNHPLKSKAAVWKQTLQVLGWQENNIGINDLPLGRMSRMSMCWSPAAMEEWPSLAWVCRKLPVRETNVRPRSGAFSCFCMKKCCKKAGHVSVFSWKFHAFHIVSCLPRRTWNIGFLLKTMNPQNVMLTGMLPVHKSDLRRRRCKKYNGSKTTYAMQKWHSSKRKDQLLKMVRPKQMLQMV